MVSKFQDLEFLLGEKTSSTFFSDSKMLCDSSGCHGLTGNAQNKVRSPHTLSEHGVPTSVTSVYSLPSSPHGGGCRVRLFATPWTVAHEASLSFTISLSLLKLRSFELVMPSNHLILCCLLLPTMLVVGISLEYPRQGKVRLEIQSHVPSDGHFSFLQQHKEEVELISFYHAVSFRQ